MCDKNEAKNKHRVLQFLLLVKGEKTDQTFFIIVSS